MSLPKISIITITYNSEATIEQTILSVLNQTYTNIEYIIVDGLSTDNTLSIIEKYKDCIHTVVSEKDKGLYDALNKGLRLATGEYTGIIHSDDFYLNHQVIEDVMRTFLDNKADAVYGDLYYVDSIDTDKITRKWHSGKYQEGKFKWGWMPPHPSFFVKKICYEQFGYFTDQLRSAADYELMLRFIHKHGIKLTYLPKFLVKMRIGGMSNKSIKNRVKANNEDAKAWKINEEKPYFFTIWLKPIRKIWQFI
jgi:glycosyltransferase involved in cell wall biosynthesis